MTEGRIALFLDFDGTLIDIAAEPDAVAVPQGLQQGLDRLSQRLGGALALVTGRSIDNLERFLGHPMVHLAGSHGGDVRAPGGVTLREGRPLPASVIEALNNFAAANGLLFERKAHGGALHYRKHPEREGDAREFAAGLADAHGLATKTGKCVIELVWPGADKGGAVDLLTARAPFTGATPVFIGDDVTDEDGFAACTRLGGFGIAVGDRPSATARYSLATVKDVHTWLEL
ncbi:MAG TPA: trehalose-phosphatase [Erythrobacter sp.]|nr:trehalose-phosphatase [Erythrobacter sp.]